MIEQAAKVADIRLIDELQRDARWPELAMSTGQAFGQYCLTTTDELFSLVDGGTPLSVPANEVRHDSTEQSSEWARRMGPSHVVIATQRVDQPGQCIVRAGLRYLNPDFWRSELASVLSHTELILLVYLLQGPSANLLGMLHVSLHVMVPESTLTEDEFGAALARLVELHVVTAVSGHLLVRVWWFHNKWRAILKGKCRPLAAEQLMEAPPQLRRAWIESSLNEGVPGAVVTAFVIEAGLNFNEVEPQVSASPIEGASPANECGIDTDNIPTTTDSDSTLSPTTTSEQIDGGGANCTSKKDENVEVELELEAISEPCRALIITECMLISSTLRQGVADAFTQRLLDAQQGIAPPISNHTAWLQRVVQKALAGKLDTTRGVHVATRRRQKQTLELRALQPDPMTAALIAQAAQKRRELQEVLVAVPAEELTSVIERTVSNISVKHRDAARTALLARKVPDGQLGALVVPPLKRVLDELANQAAEDQ